MFKWLPVENASHTPDLCKKFVLTVLYFIDLSKDEITFGRGENCDVPFIGPAAKKHQCFQAYSKVHFKLIRVSRIF